MTPIGSSGTAKSIGAVVQAMKFSDDGITAETLASLREALLEPAVSTRIDLPGPARGSRTDHRRRRGHPRGRLRRAAHRAHAHQRKRHARRPAVGPGRPRAAAATRASPAPMRWRLATAWTARRPGASKPTALNCSTRRQVPGSSTPKQREWLSWAARVHEDRPGHRPQPAPSSRRLYPAQRRPGRILAAGTAIAGRDRADPPAQAGQEADRKLPKRYRKLARNATALLRLAVLLRRVRRDRICRRCGSSDRARTMILTLPAAWLDQHPLTGPTLSGAPADDRTGHRPRAALPMHLNRHPPLPMADRHGIISLPAPQRRNPTRHAQDPCSPLL